VLLNIEEDSALSHSPLTFGI